VSVNGNIGRAIHLAKDDLLLRTERRYKNLCRQIAYAIIDGTPVDTGLLVNNWFPTINRPSSKRTASTDPTGRKSKVRVNNLLARIKFRKSFYLTNNTPYADVVEYGRYPNPPKKPTGKTVNGFSKQAPSGMLRVNLRKGLARARRMK